jgi:hypothetical protein
MRKFRRKALPVSGRLKNGDWRKDDSASLMSQMKLLNEKNENRKCGETARLMSSKFLATMKIGETHLSCVCGKTLHWFPDEL